MILAEGGQPTVENLSAVQVGAVLDVIPLELTVIDASDVVTYWNKAKDRMGKISPSVLGTDVRDCHSPASRTVVDRVIEDLRSGAEDCVVRTLPDRRVSWHALRDPGGQYVGTLEIIQRFEQQTDCDEA